MTTATHHVEPSTKSDEKDASDGEITTYLGDVIARRALDGLVKHQLGNARIAEEVQARQHPRLDELRPGRKTKVQARVQRDITQYSLAMLAVLVFAVRKVLLERLHGDLLAIAAAERLATKHRVGLSVGRRQDRFHVELGW